MADPRWRAYAAALAVFGLDRLTKWIVESQVSFADTYRVIPGFFEIVHSQNRGVAFGLFNESSSGWQTALLATLQLGAACLLGALLWNARRLDARTLWGFALILGGDLGNLFDRVAFGHVTDFLAFHIGSYEWPTFNVADSAIVVGSGLLLLDIFLTKRQAANVP